MIVLAESLTVRPDAGLLVTQRFGFDLLPLVLPYWAYLLSAAGMAALIGLGVADVGGTTSWLLGCRFASEAIGAYVGNTGTAWLQGCVFNGCTVDLDPFDAGATINIPFDAASATRAGSGTVARYTP